MYSRRLRAGAGERRFTRLFAGASGTCFVHARARICCVAAVFDAVAVMPTTSARSPLLLYALICPLPTFTPRSPTTTHRSYVSERHNYAVRVPFFCKYHQTIGPFILPAPKTVAYSPMRRASAGRRNELCCGRQIGGTLSARAVIVPGQDFTANCVVSGNSPRRWACHLSFRCYNVGKTVSACAVGAAHNLKYSFVDI
jgi:hypothetical protein